jgi:hypothetical protein
MPALPSRPSTTTARRCVASCTDRTPQRFRQAFTPAASANRGQLPRTTTALQRTLFAVVTRRVSATGASTSLPHSSATVRSLSRLCEKLGVARVQPQPVCRAVSSPPSFMLNPPSPLLATTAQPEAERGTAIPPASHIRSRQTRGPGVKWRSAFLVSSRHLKWRMRQGLPAISEAPFSPIMIVGACVQALRAAGMIEASTTRRPSMPLTRSCGSTTAVGSVPMRQVPLGWK